MKAWRSFFAVLVIALGITASLPLVSIQTASASEANGDGCPALLIRGGSGNGVPDDESKCYAQVTSNTGGSTTWVEAKGTTPDPNAKPPSQTDQQGDVDSCPAGSFVGSANSAIPGATDPRQCYTGNQNGAATSVARLTVAGAAAEKAKAESGGSQSQNCANGKNADGSCVTNTDQSAIGDCQAGGLNWVICPLIKLIQTTTGWMDQFFISTLTVDVKPIFDTTTKSGQAYYTAWNSFRIMATALIVIAGLVMVISQALGFDFLDAYTIRKVLPRLVIAIIGISLSWPLMKFTVEFFNVLGVDIRNLIYAPFRHISNGISVGQGIGVYIATFVAASVLTALGLLSFLGTALLAVLVAFFILVFRQLAIVVLVIVAPLAIACYILPNTEKVWKLWRDNFLGFLMMFPIISAFIAAGHVIAAVSFADGASGSTTGSSSISMIIGLGALIFSYFSLVFAARLASGLVGTLAGFVNDRGKGGFDRLKKYRQGKSEQRMGYYKDKYGTKMQQKKAELVRGLNSEANEAGWLRSRALRRIGRSIEGKGNNLEAQMSALNAKRSKELGDQIATGIDSEVRGLTVNKNAIDKMGWKKALAQSKVAHQNGDYDNELVRETNGRREYKTLGGGWVGEADVVNGQKRWGRDVAAQQAALSYEMRKAMTEDQVGGISKGYGALAKNQWKMTETEATGALIGAGFENQNQHLEFKNSKYDYNAETVTLDHKKFAREAYEKKGSYQLGQMSSHTISQLQESYDNGDAETKQMVQAVAESFMSRYGGGGAIGGSDDAAIAQTAAAAAQQNLAAAANAGAAGGDAAAGSGNYQTNTSGAASVAQNVRRLAEHVGVYRGDVGLPKPKPSGSPPDIRPLN